MQEAEELTGCSTQTLRRYEQRGVKDITKLARVCKAYDADLCEVIFGTDHRRAVEAMPSEMQRLIVEMAELIKRQES